MLHAGQLFCSHWACPCRLRQWYGSYMYNDAEIYQLYPERRERTCHTHVGTAGDALAVLGPLEFHHPSLPTGP